MIKIKYIIVIVKVVCEGGSFIINWNKNNKSCVIYGEIFRIFYWNFLYFLNYYFCIMDFKLIGKIKRI